MRNSEYWEKRIANNTWTTYNNLEEKNIALLEMYQEASLEIKNELYRLAEKINNGKAMTRSDVYKFNRLSKLKGNFEEIIRGLTLDIEQFYIESNLEGIANVYNNIMLSMKVADFSMPPRKAMEKMLNTQWEGRNFSESLWKNSQKLAMNLNEILVNGITQGKTITEMTVQLNNEMNKGFNVCHRLVRTETMHTLNESAFKGYVDAGCKKVQYWAAEDERVCERCGPKHSKTYDINKRPILPIHANCRCTYLPVIDTELSNKDKIRRKENIKIENENKKNLDYNYTKDGIIKITDDFKGQHKSIPKNYKPYAVIETSKVYKNGYEQIDRTLYDKKGRMCKQVHSGPHGNIKQHPYGKHGEHMHIYVWDSKGSLKSREVKELTKKEREENKDILKGDG